MIPKLPKNRTRRPTPGASTNIASHSYDPATGNLDVTFHSGHTYRYDGVSPATVENFTAASSRGRFLHDHIKPHHDATNITDTRGKSDH